MKLFSFVFLVAGATCLAGALPAAEAPSDGSDRLRSALREATAQLRTAQTDLANLQASTASFADEKKALTDKYEILKKQIVADHAMSDKTSGQLNAQLIEEKTRAARLAEALTKARAEGEKAAQAARVAEAQGAKLTEENIVLQRKIADREAKNLALFLTGNEILTRYEEFSLGNALRAKEPFVGSTRTKLENLVQDYQDKLADQRVRP